MEAVAVLLVLLWLGRVLSRLGTRREGGRDVLTLRPSRRRRAEIEHRWGAW